MLPPLITNLTRLGLAVALSTQSLAAQTSNDSVPPPQAPLVEMQDASSPQTHVLGGKVEWARLKTDGPYWDRHARSDPRLLRFIRTSAALNIDPVWHTADVDNFQQMIAYPFIFSDGLHRVTDLQGLQNLREYFKRGGFIFIDSCINTDINPDPDIFLRLQEATLQRILPDSHVERLPDNHEIYRDCFDMKDGLPHTYMNNIYNPAWAKHGLYAVYSGNHLVSLISLSGLQCGWDSMNPDPEHVTNCMKMMVNIYFYAITH